MAADRLPPQPLPENLWGDEWSFASVMAGDLLDLYQNRMIPYLAAPESLEPLRLGLASNLPIPGVAIIAGKKSRALAQWLQQVQPVSLHAIAAELDGLILFAGDVERWILTTSDDPNVKSAGQTFEQRKQAAQGLHFLLIQPDDSGMTYTGFWLLQAELRMQN
jgi:RNA-binding protein Tab2/Atab2